MLQGTEFSCSNCIGFIAFKWYYNRLHQQLTNLVLFGVHNVKHPLTWTSHTTWNWPVMRVQSCTVWLGLGAEQRFYWNFTLWS